MNNSTRQLPDSVNWVEAGAVTGVKDQGQCGSCWAFSLTSQVESYNFLATGELVELSTQQVTSCTPNTLSCGGTGGCRGSVTQVTRHSNMDSFLSTLTFILSSASTTFNCSEQWLTLTGRTCLAALETVGSVTMTWTR